MSRVSLSSYSSRRIDILRAQDSWRASASSARLRALERLARRSPRCAKTPDPSSRSLVRVGETFRLLRRRRRRSPLVVVVFDFDVGKSLRLSTSSSSSTLASASSSTSASASRPPPAPPPPRLRLRLRPPPPRPPRFASLRLHLATASAASRSPVSPPTRRRDRHLPVRARRLRASDVRASRSPLGVSRGVDTYLRGVRAEATTSCADGLLAQAARLRLVLDIARGLRRRAPRCADHIWPATRACPIVAEISVFDDYSSVLISKTRSAVGARPREAAPAGVAARDGEDEADARVSASTLEGERGLQTRRDVARGRQGTVARRRREGRLASGASTAGPARRGTRASRAGA